jgi:hypothetical protein
LGAGEEAAGLSVGVPAGFAAVGGLATPVAGGAVGPAVDVLVSAIAGAEAVALGVLADSATGVSRPAVAEMLGALGADSPAADGGSSGRWVKTSTARADAAATATPSSPRSNPRLFGRAASATATPLVVPGRGPAAYAGVGGPVT